MLLLAPATLLADFSYTETTRLTGGMIAQLSRSLGGLSKSMRRITEPQTSNVYLKGDRLAHIGSNDAQIWDLSKESVTFIDFEKKTYSTMTLAEMKAAMEKAMQRAQKNAQNAREKEKSKAELNVKMDVKQTGKTKPISGMDAREVLMTMTMEVTDTKSGQSGATEMMSSIWIVDSVPGYEELTKFYQKMAEKMASTWGLNPLGRQAGMLAGTDPKMLEWAHQMAKEAEKLKGVHVMQIMKYGSGLDPAKASEVTDPSTMPEGPTKGEVAGKAAENSAAAALGRALPGGLGRFGGFGRRGKEKEKEQAPPPQQAQPQGQAVLMEMVSESSNFSTSAVDASKLEVPAGFKQVEHPMQKMARE
jgi:hypothetical protein